MWGRWLQGPGPPAGDRPPRLRQGRPSIPFVADAPPPTRYRRPRRSSRTSSRRRRSSSLWRASRRTPWSRSCCGCVSKPWLALCSATDIRRRPPQTLSGFFHFDVDALKFRNLSGRGSPTVDPSLPFLRERYTHVTVEQCCSSLLLCQCWRPTPEGDKRDYVVCNPATEKWTVLPPIVLPECQPFNLVQNNVFLGFDVAAPSRFLVFVPLSSYLRRICRDSNLLVGNWTMGFRAEQMVCQYYSGW
uniref:Uncharacterized protein n=1 Tax=Avena sativa TaxID=4498 RepID=A0ACD5W3D6_AVESA